MVHVLIAADSDINARAFNGMTPLHMAAQCGHDEVIDLLIQESMYLKLICSFFNRSKSSDSLFCSVLLILRTFLISPTISHQN
jgi:ankyrin repeat protein